MKRNAERTKQRIFDAAMKEFSAKGFAGARIDAIAARARINKRMIYAYWGDKQELYREILRRKVTAQHDLFTSATGLPADRLVGYFEGALADPDLVRMIEWEALGAPRSLIAEQERRAAFADNVDRIRKDQKEGSLTDEIDPQYVFLMFMALTCFPIAFPQNLRLVTGMNWNDPEFQRQWAACLQTVGELLSKPERKPPAKRSRKG